MDEEFPISYISKNVLPNYASGFLPTFPNRLSMRGNVDSLGNELLITIVGTRKPSQYGYALIEHFFEKISKYKNITIVSGLAHGVDTLAHEFSLKYSIPTISVPGSGLAVSQIYPKANFELSHMILKQGGMLLSPFDPNEAARDFMFPIRNSLMAAMAHVVIVVEALQKSGSLITAHEALSFGKLVYVFPGSFFSPLSKGCHELVQKGAQVMLDVESFAEDMGIAKNSQKTLPFKSETFDTYMNEPRSLSELCDYYKKSSSEMLGELTMMELNGSIRNIGGRYQNIV